MIANTNRSARFAEFVNDAKRAVQKGTIDFPTSLSQGGRSIDLCQPDPAAGATIIMFADTVLPARRGYWRGPSLRGVAEKAPGANMDAG
jgi:hypothetical protein